MNLLTTFAQYDPQGQAMGWLLVLAIMIILPLLIVLPLVIFLIITYWKLFKKAGRNGWEAIVPFYNMYVLTEISGQNGWLFLLTLIPGVGGAIWTIMVSIKLAPAFGKDPAYAIGLIFLPIIFYPILAFGSARYVLGGPAPAQPGPQGQPMQPSQPAQPAQPEKPKDPWLAGN